MKVYCVWEQDNWNDLQTSLMGIYYNKSDAEQIRDEWSNSDKSIRYDHFISEEVIK